MDYTEIFLSIFIYSAVFYFLKTAFIKKTTCFIKKIVFGLLFFFIIAFVYLMTFIDEKQVSLSKVIIIIFLLILVSAWIFISYRKKDLDVKIESKDHILKIKGFTNIRGFKLISLLMLIVSFNLVTMIIIVTELKEVNAWIIGNIIVLILLIFWNIVFRIFLKIKVINNESIIIFNDQSYMKYDITRKFYFNLPKLLGNDEYTIKRSYKMNLIEDNVQSILWIYQISDYHIKQADDFFEPLLDLFKKDLGQSVNARLDRIVKK